MSGNRTRRSRRGRKKKSNTLSKRVSRLEQAKEKKYGYVSFATDVTNTISDGAATPTLSAQIKPLDIFGVNQGETDQKRIGDMVEAKRLQFNYTLQPHTGSTTETSLLPQWVRVILFWSLDPTKTIEDSATGKPQVQANTVSWSHLLQAATNDSLGTNCMNSFRQNDIKLAKNYAFVYDKVHSITPLTARNTVKVMFNKTYKALKVHYLAGGTLPINRRLYVAFVSNVTGVGAAAIPPSLEYQCKGIYTDG